MKTALIFLIKIWLVVLFPIQTFASQNIATVTQIQGDVEIFSHPGKTPTGPSPHVLYEGVYYSVSKAKMGSVLNQGNVLRTSAGGVARLVYENGDQITVGTATAYRVEWKETKKERSSTFHLMYGKIRFVIQKYGPRSNMQVKTINSAFGVRGTDFFISTKAEKGTDLYVLRGQVEAQSGSVVKTISTGNSARVAPQGAPVQITAKPASKPDLEAIEKATYIAETEPPKEIKAKVQSLEKKATQTTLQDIKEADPKLYEQLKEQPPASVSALNSASVSKLVEAAPAAEKSSIIEVNDEKKKDDDEAKYKSKPESWYFYAALGPQLVRGGMIELAGYVPVFNQHTIFGGGFNGGVVGPDYDEIRHMMVAASIMRFWGTNIGHGFYARTNLGAGLLEKNKDRGPGSVLIIGGGYAWPVLRGTRILFSANALLKVGTIGFSYSLGPMIGFMF